MRIFILSCIACGIMLFACNSVRAEKPIFAGNAQGMATIDITGTTLGKIETATQKVFVEDEGFSLKDSGDLTYVFERPGGRMKDLSYGALSGGGVIERAVVEIEQKSDTSFRVACNVYMVRDSGDDLEDSTKVLRAFGRQYQRILRRVAKAATGK